MYKSKDFTLHKYSELLHELKEKQYQFVAFEEYCAAKDSLVDARFVILRHDVDLKAENSLATAQIEHSLGIRASYYFRVVPQSNKPEIIKAIAELGHEIGYHYEDMAICGGDMRKAIAHFEKQLAYFRQFYPVKTICMHGAPRSRFDGRDLWKQYDYHDFGIVGEPYFDVDFSKVFYLTDTGRRWDGFNVSLRDKVPVYQDGWVRQGWVYHRTDDVIRAVGRGCFPEQLMMTTHPQRWTDSWGQWIGERFSQSAKNMVKRLMVGRVWKNP
ncbi:MAG: hypothetical protein IJP44_10840 [Bacteroidales bacterium]|nr:hypothetical protein [Bacteroidales bacterium]